MTIGDAASLQGYDTHAAATTAIQTIAPMADTAPETVQSITGTFASVTCTTVELRTADPTTASAVNQPPIPLPAGTEDGQRDFQNTWERELTNDPTEMPPMQPPYPIVIQLRKHIRGWPQQRQGGGRVHINIVHPKCPYPIGAHHVDVRPKAALSSLPTQLQDTMGTPNYKVCSMPMTQRNKSMPIRVKVPPDCPPGGSAPMAKNANMLGPDTGMDGPQTDLPGECNVCERHTTGYHNCGPHQRSGNTERPNRRGASTRTGSADQTTTACHLELSTACQSSASSRRHASRHFLQQASCHHQRPATRSRPLKESCYPVSLLEKSSSTLAAKRTQQTHPSLSLFRLPCRKAFWKKQTWRALSHHHRRRTTHPKSQPVLSCHRQAASIISTSATAAVVCSRERDI